MRLGIPLAVKEELDYDLDIVGEGHAPSPRWITRCESICSAAVRQIDYTDIPADHPVEHFYQQWQKWRSEDTLPHRKQLSPMQIKPILKWMFIFDREVEAGKPRFKVRLQGTAVCDLCHGNYAGSFLDSFTSGDCYSSREELLEQAVSSRSPQYGLVTPSMGWCDINKTSYPLQVSLGAFPFHTGSDDVGQVVVVVCPNEIDMRELLILTE